MTRIGTGEGKSKRFSEEEKRLVLKYLQQHTKQDAVKEFNIGLGTIKRWNLSANGNASHLAVAKKKSVALPVQINFCPSCGTRIPNAFILRQ